MASALIGNPVVRLAHKGDPGRLNQLGLLDRIGRIEQRGTRQVSFTGGTATVGGIASVTQPLSADGGCTRLNANRQLCRCLFTLSDADRQGRCAPKPMTGSGVAHGESIVAPTHSISTIGG